MVKFSKKLKELRLDRNMTQQQLADVIHVHRTTVKDWETKGKEPSFETLIRLVKFFEVTVNYILGADD